MKTTRSILILALAAALGVLLPGRTAVAQQSAGELFEKAIYIEEGQGDLQKAIGLYQDIVKRFAGERDVAAKAQLHIGLCYEKLGLAEAQKAFQKVVSDFPEQAEAVKRARDKLSAMVRAKAVLDKVEKTLSVRMVWSGTETASVSALTPDGRSLSYIEEESGNLCVRDVASGKRTIVVKKAQSDKPYQFPLTSRWSPDGKSLVYAWFNMDNSIELRTIGVDGSSPRALYGQKNEMAFPAAWSPDGRSIAAVVMRDFYKSFNLGLISVEDGSLKILKTLTKIKAAPMGMVFSRDGRYLIVDLPQTDGNHKHDIFALSVDGAGESRVVEHPESDNVLGWIPGSDAILFLSSRTGTYDAWTVGIVDGRAHGQPLLVRKNLGQVVPLGISPEGSLYYSVGITMSEIFTASVDLDKGAVIEPPKIVPQPLVGADEQPQWSPDGKFLAFFSKEKTAPGTRDRMILKIRSEDTGETREFKTNLEWLSRSNWSPDGRSLFVVGSDGKASLAIFRIDVRTGQETLIIDSESGANIKFIAPARDGRSVYYTYFEFGKKRARVMGIDLATRKTRELYRQDAPPDIGGLSVSPDGKALFFGTLAPDNSRVLKTIPLPEGGTPREILKSNAGAFGVSVDIHGGYSWAPDGKRILFFKEVSAGEKGKKCELSAVPIEGGPLQGLGLVVEGSPDVISLHPDGRRLAYSVSRSAAEVWVMENFLPPTPAAPKEDPNAFRVRKVWDKTPDSYFMGAASPDGRYLTYSDEYLSLGIRDLVKGENRFLLQNKSWDNVEYCYNSVFSPGGGQVAYICQVKERLTQLRIVNSDGTSTRVLRDGQDGMDYLPFGWTSDGKYILTHCSGSAIPTSGTAAPGETVSSIAFIAALDGSIKDKKSLSLNVPWAAKISLSPDGKYIAGTYLPSEDSAAKDIFLLAVEGDKEATLIKHPADDNVIGWSPDGGQFLFTSDRTGTVGVWAVRVSEGKAQGAPELVRANLGSLRPLGLTRDGELFYGISTGSSDVFIAPIDPATGEVLGPTVKALRKYETFNASPDWSPDGQFLACHSTRGVPGNESPALLIRSMRTGEVRELTPKTPGGRFAPYYLRWSPDGRTIIGTGRDEEGHVGALHAVDVRTGEAKVLARPDIGADGTGNIIALDWSADGRSINFVRIGKEFRRICNLDLETGIEKEIGRYSKASGPFWLASSPDGKHLAFYAEGKLRVLSRDGTAPRDLGVAGTGMALAWTADGKTILYGKARDGRQDVVELWSVPAGGGQPRKTGLSMSRLLVPRVSPDGKQIAFMASEQPSKSEIWVMENFLPPGKK